MSAPQYQSFNIPPGALMTSDAAETVGITNYVVKRDFRRVDNREARREGYQFFAPDASRPAEQQATPDYGDAEKEPVTGVAMARRANGQTAIIAATPTTIYRYYSLEDPRYFEGDGTADEYFLEDSGLVQPWNADGEENYFKSGLDHDYKDWEKIGRGFAADARRWQIVDVNGYMVLNNAVDLPVTFRVEDECVKPIYELRDAGIASVGRIAAFQGLLVCADIRQIMDVDMPDFMSVRIAFNPYDPFLDRYSLGLIQPSIYEAYAGKTDRYQFRVLWSMANAPRRFAASVNGRLDYGSNTLSLQYPTLAFEAGQTIVVVGAGMDGGNLAAKTTYVNSGRAFRPYSQVLHLDKIGITAAGMKPSMYGPNLVPAAFTNPVTVAVEKGKTYMLTIPSSFDFTLVNFSNDLQIKTSGLFVAAGDNVTLYPPIVPKLTGLPPAANPQGITLCLAVNPDCATVMLADSIGSIGGLFEDLEDDGSAIVGMAALRSNLIVYKETAIFVGTFTSQATAPFSFTRVYGGHDSLHFANSLITVLGGANRYEGSGGQHYHFYAGHSGYYRFDEITLAPTRVNIEVESLLFALQQPEPENVFSANNDLTDEIFLCLWDSTDDPTICFDNKHSTVSTSGAAYTAAAMIENPADGSLWFIMGTEGGVIVQYGLQETQPDAWGPGKGMFNRCGQDYPCTLQSGWGSVGSKLNDCEINAYLIRLGAQRIAGPMQVRVDTNTAGVVNTLFDLCVINTPFFSPQTNEIYVPCTGVGTVFADKIAISKADDYCEILNRSFAARELDTRGAGRG